MLSSSVAYLRCKKLCDAQSEEKIGCASDVLIISLKRYDLKRIINIIGSIHPMKGLTMICARLKLL